MIASLWRRLLIAWWCWAQHDLQAKDPASQDLAEIALRLRQLRR